MRVVSRLLAMVLVLVQTGCGDAIVRSTAENAPGFSYYLPKQLIKIEVTRTPIPTDLGDRQAKARANVQSLTAAVEARTGEVERLRAAVTKASGDGKTELTRQLQVATAFLAVEQETLTEARKTLNAADDAIRRYQAAGFELPKYRDEIKVTLLPPVADTRRRYVARIADGHGLRSTNFELKASASGLLSTGDVQSIDQSGQVIVEWINSLGKIPQATYAAKVMSAPGRALPTGLEASPKPCGSFRFEAIVDPLDRNELVQIEKGIKASCSALDFEFDIADRPMGPDTLSQAGSCQADEEGADCARRIAISALEKSELALDKLAQMGRSQSPSNEKTTSSGIYYRRKLPYVLNVSRDGTRILSQLIEIPNEAPADQLPLDGVALARSDHKVVLENGMLTEHKAVLPSSALEAAKIPGSVLSAIVAIPAGLIQLKIDTTKKQTELTTAELNYLTELAKLNAEIARQRAAVAESP